MVVYVFGLPSPKDVYKRAKDKIRKQKKDKEKKAEEGPVATTAPILVFGT